MPDTAPICRVYVPPVSQTPPTLRVQLKNRSDGKTVDVSLATEKGCYVGGSMLLSIGPHGIHRFECVNPDIGLPLDYKGRVVLTKE